MSEQLQNPPQFVHPEAHGIAVENREAYWQHHKLGLVAAQRLFEGPEDNSLAHFVIDQSKAMTDLHATNERLVNLCNTDPLTGISNRRGAELVYKGLGGLNNPTDKHEGASEKPIDTFVLVLDLDDFKSVNENDGHQAGDDVLVGIADVMRRNTRTNDVLARWGGDEFVVLLPRMPRDQATDVANAIREDVREMTPITVSIGIGMVDFGMSLEDTVSSADQALMEAKQQGKNVVVHFDELNAD